MVYLKEESKEYQDLKEQWNRRAYNIENIDDFVKFYHELFDEYHHDYGTMVGATSCVIMAAANLCAHIQGMTGFQMSCVMWDYIRNMHYRQNKSGLKIINFDDMLYPQYQDKFEKIITSSTWDALQKEAKDNLNNHRDGSHPLVVSHWNSIVNGNVPFGYKVKKEK